VHPLASRGRWVRLPRRVLPVPHPQTACLRGDAEVSQVPGGSVVCMPCSQTPVEPTAPGPLGAADVAFRSRNGVGLHVFLISGLNHTAYTLAVYASQPGSPLHHARLASGWLASLVRTGLVTRRIPIGVSDHHPPPPGLPGALRARKRCPAQPAGMALRTIFVSIETILRSISSPASSTEASTSPRTRQTSSAAAHSVADLLASL